MSLFGITSKVVIVEDNEALAEIYKTRLELIGYQVYSALDGQSALQIIEAEMPDIVLLDIMIPTISGDQVLATMRASEWGKDIKVIIISNLNESEAPAGLRQQGIEGYAIKSTLKDDDLDKLVNDILNPSTI